MIWTCFKVLFQLLAAVASVHAIINVWEYNQTLWRIKNVKQVPIPAQSVQGITVLIFPTIHRSLWFIFYIFSFGFQILSIIRNMRASDEKKISNPLHLYYTFLWFTAVLGYPSMVSIYTKTYTFCEFSSIFLVISLIPLIAWILNKTELVLLSVQLTSFVSFFANVFICAQEENYFGVAGGAFFLLALLGLSLNRHNSPIPPREILTISTTAATFCFHYSIAQILTEKSLLKMQHLSELY